MATFRGSNHQVGASAVWTNGDLANLINNLYRQSIRAGARGEYERGLRDMAQSIADATNTEIALPSPVDDVHIVHPAHAERITDRYERIEERRERTVERYAQPATVPDRRFAIRGEREAWPAPAQPSTPSTQSTFPAPADMTGDDVNITLFNPACGRLVSREIGHAWFANDGTTSYWDASQWQRVPTAEAQAWGELIPDEYDVLMRHAYANQQRRQLATNNRRLLR